MIALIFTERGGANHGVADALVRREAVSDFRNLSFRAKSRNLLLCTPVAPSRFPL